MMSKASDAAEAKAEAKAVAEDARREAQAAEAAKPDLLMVTARAVERLTRHGAHQKDIHDEIVAAIAANEPEKPNAPDAE